MIRLHLYSLPKLYSSQNVYIEDFEKHHVKKNGFEYILNIILLMHCLPMALKGRLDANKSNKN